MTHEEIRQRIQFHAEEASRLLQAHPLVAEFRRHTTKIAMYQKQLDRCEPAPTPDIPVGNSD